MAEVQETRVPQIRGGGQVMAIIPQSLDEIWRIAKMACVGQMAPRSLTDNKTPDEAISACAIAIMAGAELGLTPLMALRSYAVVNGRPSLWGDGLKAVVRQSGACEYIRSGGDLTKGWCEAKRRDNGETQRREFTWEQAKKAGLSGKKGPWQEYPDVMMERRAVSRCLNDLFADVLGGLVGADEAMDSSPIIEHQQAPAKRVPPPPPPEEKHEDVQVQETRAGDNGAEPGGADQEAVGEGTADEGGEAPNYSEVARKRFQQFVAGEDREGLISCFEEEYEPYLAQLGDQADAIRDVYEDCLAQLDALKP